MESVNSYNEIKSNPKSLVLLIGKYVTVQLIKNLSASGYVYAIDPDDYSIILLEPSCESFQTILLPGHAVLDVSEIEPPTNIKPPISRTQNVTNTDNMYTLERKQKLMEWFRQNQLPVTESQDNIVIGNVMIMPPYNVTNIFSTNVTINKQVKHIMESMPINFGET